MGTFESLSTNRQLTALTTFSDLVAEAQARATEDAIAAGMANDGVGLAERGTGATAYGQAVGVYLAFVVDKLADRGTTICSWDVSRDGLRNTFGRQAIPMVWDFAESNMFSTSSGCFDNILDWVIETIEKLPTFEQGQVRQFDAQSDCELRGIMVSSDPPYYDNIGYADLSDFFYVWLRRSLKDIYPKIFSTLLVPKREELTVAPYRNDGQENAVKFFEDGMLEACRQFHTYASDDCPVTIYYAYKQKENDKDMFSDKTATASSGWEKMLTSIINAGFSITMTHPMRTELGNRTNSLSANARGASLAENF